MQRTTITWLVLTRDLPGTIRVSGTDRLSAALILDADTGLIRGVAVDETLQQALSGAVGSALTTPAANLAPGRPAKILCPFGSASHIRPALADDGLTDVPLEEVHAGTEAEDIFDSLVGHLSGRTQPHEPPTPEDWQLLFTHATEFRQAEPWTRWSDEQHLLLTLSTDRGSAEYVAIVLGHAGLQRGLALYPGHELPAALQSFTTEAEVTSSVVLLLDPAHQLPPDITAKAHRYGWPSADSLVPAFMTLDTEGPRDPSRDDAHLLTVALAAVRAFDRNRLRAADDDAPVQGSVPLADGDTVTYAIHHRPTPRSTQAPNLRAHIAGDELITTETAVTLGHLAWDVIPELRASAHIHRPAPADAPGPRGDAVALLVLSPPQPQGAAVAAGIAALDPYGVSVVDAGHGEHAIVIVGGEGAELALIMPDRHPALLLFQRRLRQTRGRHLIMVADLESARGDGLIYGLFECHQPVAAPPRKPGPNRNTKKPKKRR